MQPNPKKVRRNEDKDYAEIYQENFLAQNDPAPLGQAAYNRQLSAGIRKRIGQDRLAKNPISKEKPVVQLPPVPFESSEFDVERGEAFTNPVQRGPGRFGIDERLGSQSGTFSGNISATQSGYTEADPITRQRAAEQRAAQPEAGLTDSTIRQFENLGYSPGALQRAEQGEGGLTDSTLPTLEEMTGPMLSEYGTPVDYTGAGLQETADLTEEEIICHRF